MWSVVQNVTESGLATQSNEHTELLSTAISRSDIITH